MASLDHFPGLWSGGAAPGDLVLDPGWLGQEDGVWGEEREKGKDYDKEGDWDQEFGITWSAYERRVLFTLSRK